MNPNHPSFRVKKKVRLVAKEKYDGRIIDLNVCVFDQQDGLKQVVCPITGKTLILEKGGMLESEHYRSWVPIEGWFEPELEYWRV